MSSSCQRISPSPRTAFPPLKTLWLTSKVVSPLVNVATSLMLECNRALRSLEQAIGVLPDLQLERGHQERDRGFVF